MASRGGSVAAEELVAEPIDRFSVNPFSGESSSFLRTLATHTSSVLTPFAGNGVPHSKAHNRLRSSTVPAFRIVRAPIELARLQKISRPLCETAPQIFVKSVISKYRASLRLELWI
jgi:hypothetical protein